MDHTGNTRVRCPLKVGQMIAGRYLVRGVLGVGSTGWVVKVADEALGGELVALKVLYPHLVRDEASLVRLRREVVLARQLAHPHIVHVHDFEENPSGETFLAMQYVRGTDLAELLFERNGRGLPFDESLYVLSKVAEALLYAHQQGIVHRDLKPSNILIGYDGQVRLCDFGLAQTFELQFGLTRTGEALGSPMYMSPEQFRAATIDQRTDIYAFGLLAFEMVTGAPPFRHEDYFRLAESHVKEPLPPMQRTGTPLPEWFDTLVRQCCEKRPEDRPTSVADFLPTLRREVPRSASMHISPPRARGLARFPRRVRLGIQAAVSLVLFLIAFELGFAQHSTKVAVMSRVFATEARLGTELRVLKWYLRMSASLLRPSSAFVLLERDKYHELEALLVADGEIRSKRETRLESPLLAKDDAGFTLLQRAVRKNSRDMLGIFDRRDIDRAKLDGDSLDPEGESLMSRALRRGERQTIETLIGLTVFNPNVVNAVSHDTALHLAIRARLYVTIDLLTSRRQANASIRDGDGLSAIHLAVVLRDPSPLRILLHNHGDPDVRDSRGRTPLMYAVQPLGPPSSAVTMAHMILQAASPDGHTLDSLDDDGRTALMYAAEKGYPDVVSLLLRRGADRAIRDHAGKTALDHAIESGADSAIVELLRKEEPVRDTAVSGAS